MENLESPRPTTREVALFGGGDPAPPRTQSEPAITAAFMAFHRQIGRSFGITDAPGRSWMGAGGWAFALLAIFGFGGGLILASFSFNEPETGIRVAGRPPEMIYTAPSTGVAVAERAELPDRQSGGESVIAPDSAVVAEHRTDNLQTKEDPLPAGARPTSAEVQSLFRLADAPLPGETANFTAAMRLVSSGSAQLSNTTGGYETGYEGMELPMVPETSPGLIVAIGAALLVAVTHLRKRRRVS